MTIPAVLCSIFTKGTKTCVQEVHKSFKECKETLDRISQKKTQLELYFCEQSSIKLEDLLKQLLSFVTDLNDARKVMQCNCYTQGGSLQCCC